MAPENRAWSADDLDASELDYNNVSLAVAQEELFNVLVELKLVGKLSAKNCCIIAFWAKHAGASGPATKLAVKPNAQSGKFSDKFDAVVGKPAESSTFYDLELARRVRHSALRVWDTIPVRLPLEAMCEQLQNDGEVLAAELRAARLDGELPPCYLEHPAVQAADPSEVIHPLSMFVDGVAYSRTDSCLGVWIKSIFSEERHLLAVLRRNESCSCGCRGWCSMHPLWESMAWSLAHMLKGEHPACRHDGSAFLPKEEARAVNAGQALGFKAVVLVVKSDICEYSHSFGFAGLGDTISPCLFCFCTDWPDLGSTIGLSPEGSGFPQKTQAHYEHACNQCEHRVLVGPREQRAISRHLCYIKGYKSRQGRGVGQDLPAYGLTTQHRIEPSLVIRDVASFENLRADPPFSAVFWHRPSETSLRHRNPLISAATGISLHCIGIDWMHTISLGVSQCMLGVFFWQCMDSNIYKISGLVEDVRLLTVVRLRADLDLWYAKKVKEGSQPTRVQNFLLTMLGTPGHPKFGYHASETNWIVRFATDFLPSHYANFGPSYHWHMQGLRSLVVIMDIIELHRLFVPPLSQQRFCEQVSLHMQACKELNISLKPKHHMLIEMAGRPLLCLKFCRFDAFLQHIGTGVGYSLVLRLAGVMLQISFRCELVCMCVCVCVLSLLPTGFHGREALHWLLVGRTRAQT